MMPWTPDDINVFRSVGITRPQRSPVQGGHAVYTETIAGRPTGPNIDNPRYQVSYQTQGRVRGVPEWGQTLTPMRLPVRAWHEIAPGREHGGNLPGQPGYNPYETAPEDQIAPLVRNVQRVGPSTAAHEGVTVDSDYVPSVAEELNFENQILPQDISPRELSTGAESMNLLKHKGSAAFSGLAQEDVVQRVLDEAEQIASGIVERYMTEPRRLEAGMMGMGQEPAAAPAEKPGFLDNLFGFARDVATKLLAEREARKLRREKEKAEVAARRGEAERIGLEIYRLNALARLKGAAAAAAQFFERPWYKNPVIIGGAAVGVVALFYFLKKKD